MRRRLAMTHLVAVIHTTIMSSLALATERVATTARRLAGPHWSVNGDWAPSVETVRHHLLTAHGIDPAGLDLEQMLTLHDNDHNRTGSRHGPGQRQRPSGASKGYRKA